MSVGGIRDGRGRVMTAHPGSATYKRGYLLASLRAGAIALILLTVLLALVLT